MEYIKSTMDFHIGEPSVVTLGKFDGLHLGHRYLMEELTRGKQQGLTSVVFTFDIPPRALGQEGYRVLSTNEEKVHIFEEAGVDYLIECPFTEEFRSLSPHAFLEMLTGKICVRRMVAGTDFCFGHKRSGTYRELREFAPEFGYEAVIVDKMQYKGADISSTRIRECISRGDMEEANHLLGYEYFVSAPVRHGNALGRTIGFPTANQLPPGEKLLPPNGVYAVHAVVNGKTYCGVCNIGRKPTIGGNYPVGIETFFFDFHGDIYDRDLRVSFVKFIRPEKKFVSVEALAAQIERDKETCRRFFGLQEQAAVNGRRGGDKFF